MGNFGRYTPAATADEKLLQKRIAEAVLHAKYGEGCWFSQFLSLREQELATAQLNKDAYGSYTFFGGHSEAERKMLCIFLGQEREFPLEGIKATFHKNYELTHRDFLGALLSLGIKRELVGDILVGTGNCVFFTTVKAAPLVYMQLRSAGRAELTLKPFHTGQTEVEKLAPLQMNVNVASLRLDAVLAAVLKKSRSVAAMLVEKGEVKVNDRQVFGPATLLCEGDFFTVKGFGKYQIAEFSGTSKKGRIFLVCVKL